MPGAELAIIEDWLAPTEADRLLTDLLSSIPWEIHRIRMFGREVASPRLSCWIGDPGASYVYSRTRFEPHPWPGALGALRARVEQACGVRFNSVLANLYRDGSDAMGWHSDDEPELGARPVIASLSLGAERRFVFRPRRRDEPGRRASELRLAHGSLLRMAGDTQQLYQHALPRTTRVTMPRINLTFRHIS
nr:alpha-ketoglutarate-dependent dioxygenase AlkB [Dyella lutea]